VELPITTLLKLRRAPETKAHWWALVALFAFPAGFFWCLDAHQGQGFLLVAALVTMLALPAYALQRDLSTLVALRRGRALEEILLSGLEPSEIVDAVATASLGSLLRSGGPVALVLAVFIPVFEWPLLLVAWLPLACLAQWAGAYLLQFLILRRGRLSLHAFGPTLVACWLAWLQPPLCLLILPAALWALYSARSLAIASLASQDPPVRRSFQSRPRLLWRTENPILARELARRPVGWRQLIVTICLALLWPFLFLSYWSQALAAIVLLNFLRSSFRTLSAIVAEREALTWESVLQTGLGPGRLAFGWICLAGVPLILEQLPLCFTVLLRWPGASHVAFGYCLMLNVSIAAGASTGLYVSALSNTRSDASSRLFAGILMATVIWAVAWGTGASLFYLLSNYDLIDVDGDWCSMWVTENLPWWCLFAVAVAGLAWSRYRFAAAMRLRPLTKGGLPHPLESQVRRLVWIPVLLSGIFTAECDGQDFTVAALSLPLGWLLGWQWRSLGLALWERLPLRSGPLVLGTLAGAWGGLLAGALPLILIPALCLIRFSTRPWAETGAAPWTTSDLLYSLQAGAFTGLILGLMEFALAWGRPRLCVNRISLCCGLREWLLRTLGAALLLSTLGGIAWQLVLLAWRCPDFGRDFSDRLIAQAEGREQAALAIPPRENGYPAWERALQDPHLDPIPSFTCHYEWTDRRDAILQDHLGNLTSAAQAPAFGLPLLTPPGPGRDQQQQRYASLLEMLSDSQDFEHVLLALRLETRLLQQGCWWLYDDTDQTIYRSRFLPRTPDQSARLLEAVRQLPCSPQDFGRAMDLRAAWVITFLQRLEQHDPSWSHQGLQQLPAPLLAYNRQRYLAAYLRARPAYYRRQAPTVSALSGATLARQLFRTSALEQAQSLAYSRDRILANPPGKAR